MPRASDGLRELVRLCDHEGRAVGRAVLIVESVEDMKIGRLAAARIALSRTPPAGQGTIAAGVIVKEFLLRPFIGREQVGFFS
jgi:hypothetical protein